MKVDTTRDIDFKMLFPILEYIQPNAKILYHYTSIEALFGGIIVKDRPSPNKEICLWASNCRYMNDPAELDTGVQLAHEVFDIPFDDSVQGISEEAKDRIHIISFSSTIDCLPMWGMYGKNGHGLALGFDTAALEATLQFAKCIYANEINKKRLKDEVLKWNELSEDWRKHFKGEDMFLKIFEDSPNLLAIYILLWVLGKNPAYEYEKEVRCYFMQKNHVKYRLKDNLIVPYVEVYLPKSALKEIWIGPTNDMDRATQSLRVYLDHMGFNNVEIKQSKVPYRE